MQLPGLSLAAQTGMVLALGLMVITVPLARYGVLIYVADSVLTGSTSRAMPPHLWSLS